MWVCKDHRDHTGQLILYLEKTILTLLFQVPSPLMHSAGGQNAPGCRSTFWTKKEMPWCLCCHLKKLMLEMPFMQRSLILEHSNLLKIQPCQPKERKPSHELCEITNRVLLLKPDGDLSPQSSPHFTVTFQYAELRPEASRSSALTLSIFMRKKVKIFSLDHPEKQNRGATTRREIQLQFFRQVLCKEAVLRVQILSEINKSSTPMQNTTVISTLPMSVRYFPESPQLQILCSQHWHILNARAVLPLPCFRNSVFRFA